MLDLTWLRQQKRFPEVEQAIQAYLKYHSKKAEPWMYLLLAVAFEVNGKAEPSIKQALGWAGFLARKNPDPFTLVEVADVLLLRGYEEIALPSGRPPVRCGELLDQAADLAPQRAEPILLSLLLAERTKDGKRMADAARRILVLGWPGVDDTWRVEVRRRAEALAKILRQEGQAEAASSLLETVTQSEPRDLLVRLTWAGDAGLDLAVKEPLGATATVLNPRTVFGGAVVQSGRGKHPESVYSCPLGFDGTYQIRVETLYSDAKDPARDVTLEVILHEGTPDEQTQTHTITLPQKDPVLVTLAGGRRKQVLPFQGPARSALVPEGQDTPAGGQPRNGSPGQAPAVQPPAAAEAADLLRAPGETGKPKRPAATSVPLETPRSKPAQPKAGSVPGGKP